MEADALNDVNWTDELLFGHPIVDAQHREIAALSEEILSFLTHRPAPAETVVILTEYCRLLSNHFSFEEGLMSKLPTGKYDSHIRPHVFSHRAIISFVKDGIKELAAGNLGITVSFRGVFVKFLDNVRVDDAQLFAILENEKILRRHGAGV